MDVMHHQTPQSSPTLNPKAPIFVPMASYQTVEDFSDQWWDLVQSSPWFRDYWLQDCFDHDDLVLPDFDAFFDHYYLTKQEEEEEEERKREKQLISVAALNWSRSGGRIEAPKYYVKAPKIVKSVKLSPRTIHQPR